MCFCLNKTLFTEIGMCQFFVTVTKILGINNLKKEKGFLDHSLKVVVHDQLIPKQKLGGRV